MRKTSYRTLLLLLATFLPTFSGLADDQASSEPSITVLLINDVYRLDNLAAVRTLRRKLESQHGPVLLLHAGDFLFPSMLSRRYQGEQMIDLMNRLDGDPDAYDSLMLATFGNHEFDKDRLQHAPLLQERIRASQFDWITSNLTFKKDEQGKPLIAGQQLRPYRLLDINGFRVGVFGLTIGEKKPAYVEAIDPAVQTARDMTAKLRAEGAELVIALTHLTMDQDKELLGRLGADGPDISFGGHEHNRQVAEIKGRWVIKADADAASAAVVQITPHQGDVPAVVQRFQIIPGEVPSDPVVAGRAAYWESRFQQEFCQERNLGSGCLDEVLGKTRTELVAEELTIRRFATNLGDWVADRALASFSGQGAQIAFINSGSLRLNHNIPAGSALTRRILEELFAYPNELVLIRLSGAQLKQLLRHAITDWTGSGHWLQIAGFEFRHHPERGLVDRVRMRTPEGLRPITDDEQILAVTNTYLVDGKGDQDGFRMLNSTMVVDQEAPRPFLRDSVISALQAAGEDGIAPVEDGRICNALYQERTCR